MANSSKLKARAKRAVALITDAENRAITKAARSDPDNPPLTAKDFKRMTKIKDMPPDLLQAVKRGRPKVEHPKEVLALRLAPQTIAALKASGPDWRARAEKAIERIARKA